MTQTLIDFDAPRFNGHDYDHARDGARLTGQMNRVFDLMKDGTFRTLGEISAATGAPHASASAQLRNLKKKRFGGHGLEKEYRGDGLYAYRLVVNHEVQAQE